MDWEDDPLDAEMKPSSIDEHLWKSVYTHKPRRIIRRTGIRYRMRDWTRVDEMFSLTGSGKFNPGMKAWAIMFLVLSFAIAIPIWAMQPGNQLFHSFQPQYEDPSQVIWQDSNLQLSDFNISANTPIFNSGCPGGFNTCIQLNSCTTCGVSFAITKNPINELAVANGKELEFGMQYFLPSCCAVGQDFGWFLTTNNTGVTSDPTNTDRNIVLMYELFRVDATHLQSILKLRNGLGGLGTPNGCSSSSSAFICGASFLQTANAGDSANIQALNYTGGQSTTNCGTGPFNGVSQTVDGDVLDGQVINCTSKLPWLDLTGANYFLGIFDRNNSPSVTFGAFTGAQNLLSFSIQYFLPIASIQVPVSNIDTGGFFGPVIRFFLAAGVFILANIITFFAYLFGLVSGVLIAAFNAIGNGLGIGNVGSSLASIFSGIGSFILNVFGTIFGYVGNFATFIQNGLSAIGNIIGTYWTQATNGFSSLSSWLSNAWTVIQAIGFWFKIGFASFLFAWMLYGTVLAFEDYNRFKLEWFNPTELFSVKIFGLVYWIGDKSFDLLWKGLQALKGWL